MAGWLHRFDGGISGLYVLRSFAVDLVAVARGGEAAPTASRAEGCLCRFQEEGQKTFFS